VLQDPTLSQDDQLRIPTDQRLYAVMAALEEGRSVDYVHNLSRIDRWFLAKVSAVCAIAVHVYYHTVIVDLPYASCARA
jgi:Carbamoyl-phosphate synthetase large chain, oligomerisation domain